MKKKESINYNEAFSVEVQEVLLSFMISDPSAFTRSRSIIKEDYFHDTIRAGVRFVLEYSDEFRALPLPELIEAKTGVKTVKIEDVPLDMHAWFLKEIEGFCRYKALEIAIVSGVDLLEKGEGGEIERMVRDAMTISLMSDLGISYFNDPKTRLERLRDKSSYVSTGWSVLDEKLYGGFSRGALNVFAGGSGSGKSLFLQNIALNWVFAGLNVVYITLELSEDLVSLRLDAMVTGMGTSEVMRDINDSALRVAFKGKGSGELTIKKLPEGGTTANDLRAFLKEYEIKTGKKPDAIVVDYLDLMYPNNRRVDPSDLFVKDKFTSEEMRALAHEFDVLCVTASQLNRQSIEAMGEFDHSHIAGGISKINTADNVFGIFTTAAMKERGVYILHFLKTRSSAAVGQKIELHYDPVSMRISDPKIFSESPHKPSSIASLKETMKSKFKTEDTPDKETGRTKPSVGIMGLMDKVNNGRTKTDL